SGGRGGAPHHEYTACLHSIHRLRCRNGRWQPDTGAPGHSRRCWCLHDLAGEVLSMRNTRVRVPETAASGEIIDIRVMVMHPMDTGFSYNSQGERIPVNIITDFTCHYLGEEVVSITLAPGLSANPYFAFRLRATES